MKKIFLALAAFSLSATGACTAIPGFSTVSAPAPLAATVIDDQGLEVAWKAFDLALDGINFLGDLNIIKPGSPAGKQVAVGIRATNSALAAAERAAAAGSTRDYKVALEEGLAALQGLRDTVASLKGSN